MRDPIKSLKELDIHIAELIGFIDSMPYDSWDSKSLDLFTNQLIAMEDSRQVLTLRISSLLRKKLNGARKTQTLTTPSDSHERKVPEDTDTEKEPCLDKPLTKRIVAYLNELIKLDRVAIAALVENRVPCSQSLTDHPTVQVVEQHGGHSVGLLGILNGLCGVDEFGIGPIRVVFSLPNDSTDLPCIDCFIAALPKDSPKPASPSTLLRTQHVHARVPVYVPSDD